MELGDFSKENSKLVKDVKCRKEASSVNTGGGAVRRAVRRRGGSFPARGARHQPTHATRESAAERCDRVRPTVRAHLHARTMCHVFITESYLPHSIPNP